MPFKSECSEPDQTLCHHTVVRPVWIRVISMSYLNDVQHPLLENREYGPTAADAACIWALALSTMIQDKGYSTRDLENMNASTFEDIQAVFSEVDFEGTTGRVRYVDQDFSLPGPDPVSPIALG